MTLTPDDLADLIAVLDSADVDRLHLRTARLEITLRRGRHGLWRQSTQVLTTPVLAPDPSPVPTPHVAGDHARAHLPGGASVHDHQQGVVGDGLVAVTAPLVGTFYRAPSPGQPPFIEVGSRVGAATVIGIVETMKLMNSVPAGIDGVVTEICVEDARPVGQGAVLVLVRPDEDLVRPDEDLVRADEDLVRADEPPRAEPG